METIHDPQTIMGSITGAVFAALLWVVRGYANDVRKIKATYMTRSEIENTIAASAKATADLIAAHTVANSAAFAELRAAAISRQEENTSNFRELRVRLDTINDTMLKVALK